MISALANMGIVDYVCLLFKIILGNSNFSLTLFGILSNIRRSGLGETNYGSENKNNPPKIASFKMF